MLARAEEKESRGERLAEVALGLFADLERERVCALHLQCLYEFIFKNNISIKMQLIETILFTFLNFLFLFYIFSTFALCFYCIIY